MACPEQTKDPVAYSCKIADTFSLASLYWSPVSICLFRQGRPECFEHNGALMCSLSPPWRPSRLSVWHKEGCKLLSFHSHFNHQWMGVHLKMGSVFFFFKAVQTDALLTLSLLEKTKLIAVCMIIIAVGTDICPHVFVHHWLLLCLSLNTPSYFQLPVSEMSFLLLQSHLCFSYLYAASLSAIPYSLRWRCTWESFYKYSTPFWHSIDRW